MQLEAVAFVEGNAVHPLSRGWGKGEEVGGGTRLKRMLSLGRLTPLGRWRWAAVAHCSGCQMRNLVTCRKPRGKWSGTCNLFSDLHLPVSTACLLAFRSIMAAGRPCCREMQSLPRVRRATRGQMHGGAAGGQAQQMPSALRSTDDWTFWPIAQDMNRCIAADAASLEGPAR